MRRSLAAVALGVFVLVGCGQSDEEAAEETAVANSEAIGDGDYEDACGMTVDDLVDNFDKDGVPGTTCEDILGNIALEHSFGSPEATGNVELNGDVAKVQVESEGTTYTARLEKNDDDWKVALFDPRAPY